MEIKNVRVDEIHWSIGWNASQEANKRLRDKIGETSKYFAQLKVGNATYNWLVDTVGKWRPMGGAPDSDKIAIMEKAEEIRQEVFEKLPGDEALATKICQVPNYEEYIFYKDSGDGTPDVVITGWGFHNFKKAGPFKETWPPLPVIHTTTIVFIADGERQPGRSFSVVTPKMQKPDVTDEQGVRAFREYAGTTITLIDDITKRQFSFTTGDEDVELEFDVTGKKEEPQPDKCAISIQATLDGEPLPNETVSVDYGGQHYDVQLNDEGKATIADVLCSGESCEASLRDEHCSIVPVKDGDNVISFEIVTPVQEPVMATITALDAKQQPMKNAQLRLWQGDKKFEGVHDEQGRLQFDMNQFTVGQPIQAYLLAEGQKAAEAIELILESDERDYLLQQNAPKQGSRLFEIIMMLLLLAALAALVVFALKPGIEELSHFINNSIF